MEVIRIINRPHYLHRIYSSHLIPHHQFEVYFDAPKQNLYFLPSLLFSHDP